MQNHITHAELYALFKPYEGHRLHDASLEHFQARARVDITHHQVLKVLDADIRLVDETGLNYFHDASNERILFANISRVVIRRGENDREGRVYEVAALRKAVAA